VAAVQVALSLTRCWTWDATPPVRCHTACGVQVVAHTISSDFLQPSGPYRLYRAEQFWASIEKRQSGCRGRARHHHVPLCRLWRLHCSLSRLPQSLKSRLRVRARWGCRVQQLLCCVDACRHTIPTHVLLQVAKSCCRPLTLTGGVVLLGVMVRSMQPHEHRTGSAGSRTHKRHLSQGAAAAAAAAAAAVAEAVQSIAPCHPSLCCSLVNAATPHLQNHCCMACLQVEAEEVDDVTERFGVTAVPHFVLLQVYMPVWRQQVLLTLLQTHA
jgi:hypothetical protein